YCRRLLCHAPRQRVPTVQKTGPNLQPMRPLLKPAPDGSMIESLFTPWLQEDPDVSPRVRQKCTLSMRTRYLVVPLLRIVPYANLVKATQRLPHTVSISR